jgi:glucose-1-phosphate thymidylyltransferase
VVPPATHAPYGGTEHAAAEDMKVIIPLAGKGTRLRPHTHVVPKPMLKVAGRPVMSYILDDLRKLGDIEEVIYITGHLKEKVEQYARQALDVRTVFVEQQVQNGTAGAVALARPYVDQPVLIIFVDTIFDADLSVIDRTDADGIIWTKEVEDYQRFGVVVTDAEGFMTRIVEKPTTPISKRANIGLHFVRDWRLMFEGIDHVLASPPTKGEYYLTDAFQYMIEHGAHIKVVDVEGWFDAGKLDTLLETNRAMLQRGRARRPTAVPGSTIVDPVYIEDGVAVRNSRIGPNVSIGTGSVIEGSELRDTIIGSHAQIRDSRLHDSLVGDHVMLDGVRGEVTVGDHSEIRSGQ